MLLSGLGITIAEALARWGFGTMLATDDLMGSFGGGVIYTGPPELKDEVLGQWGLGATTSPFGGVGGFALGFANITRIFQHILSIKRLFLP